MELVHGRPLTDLIGEDGLPIDRLLEFADGHPRAGIVGAAWASTVAYTVGATVMLLRFRQATGLPWTEILVPRPSDFRH